MSFFEEDEFPGTRMYNFVYINGLAPDRILQPHRTGAYFTDSPQRCVFYSLAGGAPVLQPHRRRVCVTASPAARLFYSLTTARLFYSLSAARLFYSLSAARLYCSLTGARGPISPERLAWSVRARSAFRAAEAVKYSNAMRPPTDSVERRLFYSISCGVCI